MQVSELGWQVHLLISFISVRGPEISTNNVIKKVQNKQKTYTLTKYKFKHEKMSQMWGELKRVRWIEPRNAKRKLEKTFFSFLQKQRQTSPDVSWHLPKFLGWKSPRADSPPFPLPPPRRVKIQLPLGFTSFLKSYKFVSVLCATSFLHSIVKLGFVL